MEKLSKTFAHILNKAKLKDVLSVAFIGQAFEPYNNAGRHLKFSKCTITSVDAIQQILPNIPLNDRYSLFFIFKVTFKMNKE